MKTFYAYSAHVPTDPEFYGTDCTPETAQNIAQNLRYLIQAKFPGIDVRQCRRQDDRHRGRTCGPDESTLDDIDRWIATHWTDACTTAPDPAP